MTTPGAVQVGTYWRGVTGNLLVVTEVNGESARLASVTDSGDFTWEYRSDVAAYLDLAEHAPGAVLNPEAIGDLDATPVVCLSPGMISAMSGCVCGGLNGFHADECTGFVPWSAAPEATP